MRGGLSSAFSNLRFETIGSVAAIIMSVAAIFVAWDQSMVMRAQQHATVWPILDTYFITDYDDDRLYFQLVFENAGVGPALIRRTRLFLDDQFISHYSELGPYLPERLHYDYQTSGGGFVRTLGPERQEVIFQIDWPRDEELDAAWLELRDRSVSGIPPILVGEICYCSVFERCWVTTTGATTPPEQVGTCRVEEADDYNFLSEAVEMPGAPVTEQPIIETPAGEVPQGNPTTEAGVLPGLRKE